MELLGTVGWGIELALADAAKTLPEELYQFVLPLAARERLGSFTS